MEEKYDRDSIKIFTILFLSSLLNFSFHWGHISSNQNKNLEIRQKYSAACRIFHLFLVVWKLRGQTSRSRIVLLLNFRMKKSETMIMIHILQCFL